VLAVGGQRRSYRLPPLLLRAAIQHQEVVEQLEGSPALRLVYLQAPEKLRQVLPAPIRIAQPQGVLVEGEGPNRQDRLGHLAVLRLHAARHHWAVTNLRAGVPVAVVQYQLGHSSASMTLNTYGAFLPSAADREHWRATVAAAERKRAESRGL
jgi:hypothetical protein